MLLVRRRRRARRGPAARKIDGQSRRHLLQAVHLHVSRAHARLRATHGQTAYAATYTVKDGQLQFTRTLVQHAAAIPVEQYTDVRSFFEHIRAAEQTPVVLARK
jgi:hypothetical protein